MIAKFSIFDPILIPDNFDHVFIQFLRNIIG